MSNKVKLKQFEILDIKAYVVNAFSEEHALRKFNREDIAYEGDSWPEVRELGPAYAHDLTSVD